MVDLHLHTTVSDGRLTPQALVARAALAGLRVMAVTDHDTTQATPVVLALAAERGIEAVSGIEITAVENGRDIHILGYFIDHASVRLAAFLAEQRARRLDRAEAIGRRLASLGMPVAVQPLVAEVQRDAGRSLGRPQIAQAMLAAGYVSTMAEAFDRWLAQGRPAFVPREGPDCESVIDVIHHAHGLASLAHPAKTSVDSRIPALCDAGLDALEVHHPDHSPVHVERYLRLAQEAGVLVTGGSDFHGDPHQRREPGGRVLPGDDWTRLKAASGTHA